ncbi:MAG: DUF4457 domain-containing protein, partial [Limisphaerales bacterium]
MKTNFNYYRTFFLSTVTLFSLLARSQAAEIQGVTISAVSSEFVSGTDQRRATNLVNGSGLFGDAHTIVPQGAMWLTSPATNNAFTNAFVTFDLGNVRTLSKMKVWNYNEAGALTRRGIQTANISVAGEDLVFTTNLVNQTFLRAPGLLTNFAQLIEMGGVQGRYVRINVVSNYLEAGDTRVGLSEVRFIDPNVRPTINFASRNFSNDRVTVLFSEPVLPSSATNVGNYSISSGATTATILSAAMDLFSNRVVLQTSTLNSNLVYMLTARNVRDAADLISIPTNITVQIEPELALWLKADVVAANGDGTVSLWPDQSGNNNHAIQSNTVSMPVLVPNAINGKPVVRFNGVTNFMDVAHSSSLMTMGDLTIYAVVRFEDYLNFNSIIAKSAGNLAAPFDLYLNKASPMRFFRGNGSGNSLVTATTVPSLGAYHIISAIARGTNGNQYLN